MGLFVLLHFFIICEFFVFHFSDVKITEVPSPLLFLVVNTVHCSHRDFCLEFNCDEAADENDHNISVCVDKCCVGIIRQQCGHYEPLSSTTIPAT